jgi:hypothetical protein
VQLKNGVCQAKSNATALSFQGFTSGAFRKAWANIGEELDDPSLKEAGPKAMDHSRSVTERFYLSTRMKNTVAFSKAVGKNFIAGKNREEEEEMSGSSSGDEQNETDDDEKEEVDDTVNPKAKGLNAVQLQLVLKYFPMKGVKASSVTATGCDRAAKTDQAFKALYQALQQCIRAKCGDQTCKSGGRKCTYCHNPPLLARKTMAYALRSYSNKLKKSEIPDEDIIEDSN